MRDLPDTPIMRALTLLGTAIDRRNNSIPILNNVLLAVRDGRLYMTATDLDCEISVDVESAKAPGFTLTAGHEPLRRIVEVCGAVGFAPSDAAGGGLYILSESATYVLATLRADDFPKLKTGDFPHSFRTKAAELLADLKAVRYGISTEETRYYLNGIYMHLCETDARHSARHLRFAATDGHRLFMIRRPVPNGLGGMPGVIIPRRAIKSLIVALEQGGHDDVQIEVSDAYMRFTLTGVTITSKVIDGTFPDYARVIPTANETRLTCSAAELSKAAARALAIHSERTSSLTINFGKDGHALVSAKSPENGTMMDMPLTGVVTGPLFAGIGLNAAYLRDCCEPFGDASVVLAMDGPVSPVLITAADDPTGRLTVVQMPMRVS